MNSIANCKRGSPDVEPMASASSRSWHSRRRRRGVRADGEGLVPEKLVEEARSWRVGRRRWGAA